MSLSFKGLYQFDEFRLDPARRLFSRGDVPLAVSPKAFEVLCYLVAHSGRVVTKEELLRAVWPDSFVEESNLPQYVSSLRKVLADRAGLIATIPGRGYQFAATVVQESHEIAVAASDFPLLPTQTVRETSHMVFTETSRQISAPIRRSFPHWSVWLAAVAALLAAYLVLRAHVSNQLHISNYSQITHDGHPKSIGGTDGSRIYFTRVETGSIDQVSVSGGAAAPIQTALNDAWAGDVSPDGSTLLIISNAGGLGPADSLWSLRILEGTVRRLGNAVSSTWSPDAEKIAYATANGDIYLMRSVGMESQRIASVGGYLKSLAWSPNGETIRFSKGGFLWEIASDGTNLHQLLPGWGSSAAQSSGQWAPNGDFFFVADGQICLLNEHRMLLGKRIAQPIQLTFGPIAWDRPVLSPNGKQIFASGRTMRGELVRFDPHSQQMKPFLAGISAEFVSFAQDGKSLAYVTYPEGVLWRANPDGSHPIQLTEPPVYPKSLRWSPDGTQIVFVDRSARGTDSIYVVASDGSARPRQLVSESGQAETDPSWSPDGRKLVYSTSPNVGASAQSDLRILDLTTGKGTVIPESDGLLVPRWSPDGQSIAAMTLDTMGMKLLNTSSGTWTKLNTGSVAFPEWSRDGRYLYYVRWTTAQTLVRIRVGDGKLETVADLKGERYTGVYTLWMALDPSDKPMLLRDVGTDDIYALKLDRR